MATQKKKQTNEAAEAKKKKIKMAAGALGIVLLLFAGFILGIYLKIFDQEEMNEKYAIYDWPIIGETFVRPVEDEGVEETEQAKKEALEAAKKKEEEDKKKSKPIKLTKEEIEKQTQEREAAEKKRIGKLSRLYNEMKPAEAATILTGLDDDMAIAIMQKMDESQVSQILAAKEFGADHAATITRKMYQGTPKRVTNPNDEE